MEEQKKKSIAAQDSSSGLHNRQQTKRIIIACVVTALITLLIITAGLTGAFLLGNSTKNDIEEKRQTVVQEGEVIADIAQKVGKSVVSIVTQQQSRVEDPFFGSRSRTTQAAGTGIIVNKNGLILTNKHVVPQGTNTVEIVTSEGVRYEDVQIVGRDPLNDLAILKVKNPKNFQPATLGNSKNVRVGQKVIAIGNALGQFQNTVTAGIISGIGRPVAASNQSGAVTEQLTNLFQTDAAINSGNSGGPLLNFNGEVIGVNTAVAADAENIGFAIPINEAKGIIESVEETGELLRPYIGVRYVMLTADLAKQLGLSVDVGAYVSKEANSVIAGSPADKAGIEPGDVITKVGDIDLSQTSSLASAIGSYKVGDTVEITIVRDGKERMVSVTLAEAPAN